MTAEIKQVRTTSNQMKRGNVVVGIPNSFQNKPVEESLEMVDITGVAEKYVNRFDDPSDMYA